MRNEQVLTPQQRQILQEVLTSVLPQETLARLSIFQTENQDFSRFKEDIIGYAENIIGAWLWKKQRDVCRAIQNHQKVMVCSANTTGKSFLAGGILVNWFYDTYNPGICLTSAPTEEQVKDILWKEVRVARKGRPGLKPAEATLQDAPNHFAKGFTTRDYHSFQGRHEANMLILLDEATGIPAPFWEAATSMINKDTHRWVVIFNPLDSTTYAYQEYRKNTWHKIHMSALEHPNIQAELEGKPAPIPSAVRLSWVERMLVEYCTPVSSQDANPTQDFEWPPNSNTWYKISPVFEARVLGRWPSQIATALWSEALISYCETTTFALPSKGSKDAPEIGVDVARQGDDYTVFIVRWGRSVVFHERYQGFDFKFTTGKLKDLASTWGAKTGHEAKKIPCKIDVTGDRGSALVDFADGFNFIPVNSSSKAISQKAYKNRRSELWDVTAKFANDRLLEWSRLSQQSKDLLRTQLMAPRRNYDAAGRAVISDKDEIKKILKFSPDDADALNLCVSTSFFSPPQQQEKPKGDRMDWFYKTATQFGDYPSWKTAHL